MSITRCSSSVLTGAGAAAWAGGAVWATAAGCASGANKRVSAKTRQAKPFRRSQIDGDSGMVSLTRVPAKHERGKGTVQHAHKVNTLWAVHRRWYRDVGPM